MADVLNTTGLGSFLTLTSTFAGFLTNAINLTQTKFDQWFPPAQREYWKGRATKFATEHPKIAAFLFSQVALSGPALALFFCLVITIAVFALLAGILVGLLGAVAFIVLAVGVALIFLLP